MTAPAVSAAGFPQDPALRRRLVLAGTLAVLALGLPWTTAYYVSGYYDPGFCSTTFNADGDGTVYCTVGILSPGHTSPALPGFTIDVRVFAALMLIAGIMGLRRHSPALLGLALAIGVAALIRNPGTQAGQLLWAAALVVSGIALARTGALGERAQCRIQRLRPGTRTPAG